MKWVDKINRAEKQFDTWRKNGEKITNRFRGRVQEGYTDHVEYNMHWANGELFVAMAYPRTPDPVVRRRWPDNISAINLAETLQAAIKFTIDTYDFDSVMEPAMLDFFNAGMGQVRLHYRPYFTNSEREKIRVSVEETSVNGEIKNVYRDANGNKVKEEEFEVDQDGAFVYGDYQEEVSYEEIDFEFVPWDRFGYDPDPVVWRDVEWAYIIHFMSEAQVKKNFGRRAVSHFGFSARREHDAPGVTTQYQGKRTKVYEVFDKVNRKLIFVSPDYDKNDGVIKTIDDPWGLENFYPFPEPLFATVTSNKLVPVPHYQIAEPLYQELDEVQTRIFAILSAIKIRGACNAEYQDSLQHLLRQDDNHLIPIDSWQGFAENGGLPYHMNLVDINPLISAINTLTQHRNIVRDQIAEITGYSDLQRGMGKASETATAQRIKTGYANSRMERQVKKVNRFIRDVYRLAGEMIAEHFSAKTLSVVTGKPVTEQHMELIRDDINRAILIDIETDDTAFENDQEARQQVIDFMRTLAELANSVPLLQGVGLDQEFIKQFMGHIMNAFPHSRKFREMLEGQPNVGMPPQPPQQAGPPQANGQAPA